MGKNSNMMNYYFSDEERFADLFNGVFFQGKPVERIHDVCKKLKTGSTLRILALENQELVDYAMPFRCMQYDVMEYGKQLEELRR